MRVPFAAPIILLLFHSLAWAAEPEVIPHLDSNDPVALREAIRLLDEEVKLAARPQTYVVIDLVTNALIIKGRGVELHRLPIQQWTASRLENITSTFRLRERPPVNRPKIEPAGGAERSPISLDDMPSEFSLSFTPSLTVTIEPFAPDNPWRWLAFKGQEWWLWFKGRFLALVSGNPVPSTPSLQLTLTHDHAQSLAWTLTEGMPFLIRRASTQ